MAEASLGYIGRDIPKIFLVKKPFSLEAVFPAHLVLYLHLYLSVRFANTKNLRYLSVPAHPSNDASNITGALKRNIIH